MLNSRIAKNSIKVTLLFGLEVLPSVTKPLRVTIPNLSPWKIGGSSVLYWFTNFKSCKIGVLIETFLRVALSAALIK